MDNGSGVHSLRLSRSRADTYTVDEPAQDADVRRDGRTGIRRDVRAAVFGGQAATFVVAAAFAPKLLSHPTDVRFHQTAAEATVSTDTGDTTASVGLTTTTEAPTTTTTVAPRNTTTVAAPVTTTTVPPTTTTTEAPTTTTTLAKVWPAVLPSDPAKGPAITGLRVSNLTPRDADLSWDPNPLVPPRSVTPWGYSIRRWDGYHWIYVTDVVGAQTTYQLWLSPDTDYDFVVYPDLSDGSEGNPSQITFHSPA
jgi:hypothetical protein